MCIADHGKQRPILIITINCPSGIEDLVTAMLTIGLRKHDELYIARITLKAYKVLC